MGSKTILDWSMLLYLLSRKPLLNVLNNIHEGSNVLSINLQMVLFQLPMRTSLNGLWPESLRTGSVEELHVMLGAEEKTMGLTIFPLGLNASGGNFCFWSD